MSIHRYACIELVEGSKPRRSVIDNIDIELGERWSGCRRYHSCDEEKDDQKVTLTEILLALCGKNPRKHQSKDNARLQAEGKDENLSRVDEFQAEIGTGQQLVVMEPKIWNWARAEVGSVR